MATFCEHDNELYVSTEVMARFKSMDFQGRSPSSGLYRPPKKEAPNSSKTSLFMY
jgi:hypothetical protein